MEMHNNVIDNTITATNNSTRSTGIGEKEMMVMNDDGIKKKEDSKFYEVLFLSAMAGFGVLVGFSNGLSLAKKKDEKAFNQGLMMINDRPHAPPMESGTRLAMRALGLGSLWAVSGVAAISGLIWWTSGAKDLKDFRQRMGNILPRIPRNETPQGRTEFESFRDLFTYLGEESEKQKKNKQQETNKDSID